MLQCMVFGLFIKDLTHILISTAPPMSPLGALFIRLFRRVRIVYWVMDLNPDQLVAIKKLSEHSLIVRFSDAVNCLIFRYAYRVIALDEFMAKRLAKKSILGHVFSLYRLGRMRTSWQQLITLIIHLGESTILEINSLSCTVAI